MAITLKEYMYEEKPVSRLFVLMVGLVGAFCGAILGILYGLLGVLI